MAEAFTPDYAIGFNDGICAAVDVLEDHDKREALDILYSLMEGN